MSEVTVAVPVIHNAVCEVFGNSGKLGQLFDVRSVEINGGGHIGDLDVFPLREVLHTSRAE